jgi:hypothetical protein
MSPLASTTSSNITGGPYRKPRADVYTFLLVVSLLAIILGCVCLYFEMQRFEFKFKEQDVPRPPVAAAPAAPGAMFACLPPQTFLTQG